MKMMTRRAIAQTGKRVALSVLGLGMTTAVNGLLASAGDDVYKSGEVTLWARGDPCILVGMIGKRGGTGITGTLLGRRIPDDGLGCGCIGGPLGAC